MTIWRTVPGASTGPMESPCVVTIGNFDGVHRGHQLVVAVAADKSIPATGMPLRVVAVTFDPHPLTVIAPGHQPKQLSTIEARVELLKDAGAEFVYVLAFSTTMADWSPEEFVQRVIVEQLKAATVVVGENFRFGHGAAGDCAELRVLGRQLGFLVETVTLGGDEQPWSSTAVRQLVAHGDVGSATQMLGRPYVVSGTVVQGDRRGRELGYPTANIAAPNWRAVPADGVYAGRVSVGDDRAMPAAISVGTNPTFAGTERRIESFVLDRDDLELYGSCISVEFVAKIRDQATFGSHDELIAAIDEDVSRVRQILDDAATVSQQP